MKNNDQETSRLAEQYDKLASKYNELYLTGKQRGRESMSVALDEAHDQLAALGEFSAEQGAELKQYLARDLDQTIYTLLVKICCVFFYQHIYPQKTIDCNRRHCTGLSANYA
jgi:hypothetical protein